MIRWFLSLLDPELRESRERSVEIEKENTLLRKQLHDVHSAYRKAQTEAAEWRAIAEGRIVGRP